MGTTPGPFPPAASPAGCTGGFFGPGCALRCGCAGGADCDPVTGQCHCVDGYTGPTCQQGEPGSWGARAPSPESLSRLPTHRTGWARPSQGGAGASEWLLTGTLSPHSHWAAGPSPACCPPEGAPLPPAPGGGGGWPRLQTRPGGRAGCPAVRLQAELGRVRGQNLDPGPPSPFWGAVQSPPPAPPRTPWSATPGPARHRTCALRGSRLWGEVGIHLGVKALQTG